jgi:hypothetical protein
MGPTLVILAAGFGTRFGGNKQLTALGPGGRPLLAYALHDAARAGFSRAILVVREGLEAPLRAVVAGSSELPLEFALQESRAGERPWGTGHAVLAAASRVRTAFMVVNADDFYGAATFRVMSAFLAQLTAPATPVVGALATFPLGQTLSPNGPVNRGVCRRDADGFLAAIEEVRGIDPTGSGWPLDTPVSLNGWGFDPSILPLVQQQFTTFQDGLEQGSREEFMLPSVVNHLIASSQLRIRLLAAPGPWIGLTWPADLPAARAHLARMAAAGEYPATW